MRVSKWLLVTGAVMLCAAPAMAQSADGPLAKGGLSVGVAGGYYVPGGDDFETTEAGFGGEASLRYNMSPHFQLVGGFGVSLHDDSRFDATINNVRVSVEPRLFFPVSNSNLLPFIGGRAAWMYNNVPTIEPSPSQSGFLFGGVGGLQFSMGPKTSLEASVLFGSASFGDWEALGQTLEDSDASGSLLALQLGVVFKFGGR